MKSKSESNRNTGFCQIAFSAGDGLDFAEERHTAYRECAVHCHEETKLVLLLEGALDDIRKQQTIYRAPMTLMILPAGELHGARVQSGVRYFEIRIQPHWLERYQHHSLLVETPTEFQQGLATWLSLRLYREFQSQDSLSCLMLEALTLELLVEMTRTTHHPGANRVPRWLREACDFLHEVFRESLTLEVIAATAGVHPAHLTRGFRQHLHCTPGDYVRRLRIEYACHLLATSDTPLAQIALDAGFSHQSHFCRAFKGLTGMTPAEYQRISRRTVRAPSLTEWEATEGN